MNSPKYASAFFVVGIQVNLLGGSKGLGFVGSGSGEMGERQEQGKQQQNMSDKEARVCKWAREAA
jgi:hypothetical protein